MESKTETWIIISIIIFSACTLLTVLMFGILDYRITELERNAMPVIKIQEVKK